MNGREWTNEDNEKLRALYPHSPTSDVAKVLERSKSATYGQARKLSLHKSKAYLASPAACRLRRGDQVGKSYRFPPGHVPANKGLRRPGWSPGRMRETQFKAGERQGVAKKRWKPVGTIMPNGDGYLRIKVADQPESIAGKGATSTNWEFVHKRVWEAEHGPIPPGHRIWWKDGDHSNCAIENLELLSDREHMARTTIHNLPPELKDTIRLVVRVKRAIKKRTKEDGKEQAGGSQESSIRNAGGAKGRRETNGR